MKGNNKTCLVFCDGVLKHVNKAGKTIAFVNFWHYGREWAKENYPQFYEQFLCTGQKSKFVLKS